MREQPLHLTEVAQRVLDAPGQLIFLAGIHLDRGPEDGVSCRVSTAQARAKCTGLSLPLSKGITLHARSDLAGHCERTRVPSVFSHAGRAVIGGELQLDEHHFPSVKIIRPTSQNSAGSSEHSR